MTISDFRTHYLVNTKFNKKEQRRFQYVCHQSNEPVEAESRRGVMRAEVKWRNFRVFPCCKALLKECTSRWIQSSHRLQTQPRPRLMTYKVAKLNQSLSGHQ